MGMKKKEGFLVMVTLLYQVPPLPNPCNSTVMVPGGNSLSAD